MLQVNGSAATTDAMFVQLAAQLKPSKPNVTEEQWAGLKKEVFDVDVAELNNQPDPVIKKHYTNDDMKAIIAFYEMPVVKKLYVNCRFRSDNKLCSP